MNENAIHGAPKNGLRIKNCTKQSLRITPNSKVEDTLTTTQLMGLRKRLRMENCTKQSLRIAPNSKVEDA